MRSLFKVALSLLLVSFLFGCATKNTNYHKIYDKQKESYISASYIQWNSEYAVTAKHNKYPEKPDYISEKYDLVFFKHPADARFDPNTVWRNPYIEEEVVHVGSSSSQNTLSRNGKFINQEVLYLNEPYSISSATVFKGMSGGPVYSEDKKFILGMTVAKASNAKINDVTYPHIAFFLQTEVIEKEWENFQTKK